MRQIKNDKLKKELNKIVSKLKLEYKVGTGYKYIKPSQYDIEFVDFSRQYNGITYLNNNGKHKIKLALQDNKYNDKPFESIVATFLHEITHIIQYLEGDWQDKVGGKGIHSKYFEAKLNSILQSYDETYGANIARKVANKPIILKECKRLNKLHQEYFNALCDRFYSGELTKEELRIQVNKADEIHNTQLRQLKAQLI